jgi:hypothetical protein
LICVGTPNEFCGGSPSQFPITRVSLGSPSSLKVQPARNLQKSRIVELRSDPAELSITQLSIGATKLYPVEQVERLCAEVERNVFVYRKILEQGHVPIGGARSAHGAVGARFIAKGEVGRDSKTTGVEVSVG